MSRALPNGEEHDGAPSRQGAVRIDAPFAGPAFGDLVHKVFESGGAAALDSAIAALQSGAEGDTRDWARALTGADRAALQRYFTRLEADPALRALAAAPLIRREVPFLLPVGEDFLSGTLDALVAFPDGSLALLDYKTNRAVPADVDSLAPAHRRQALLSAFAIATITGRPVREFRFSYVAADPVVVISLAIDEDALAQARSLVDRLRREAGDVTSTKAESGD